ncbi:MAG TPA: lipid-binding SYLF domain-containing protein [Candidatus Bathyarchaeia archaeon]|nr:lipid-binding SYLF domain-containing protein [Candidatus Bathyarchaeia archaeon]
MRKVLLSFVAAMFALASLTIASAQDRATINNQLDKSAQIVQELTSPNTTAGIPHQVLEGAKCIAVIPGMKQAGFIIGGKHGDGVATCKLSNGRWSPPAPFQTTGGNFGLQIGAESVDVVMMVMNDQGMQSLESGHFKVGGEVNAAAGPVGRDADAEAGWKAAILTYAKAKGVYGGITINGVELNQHKKNTEALYGRDVPFAEILRGQAPMTHDPAVKQFLTTIHSAEENAHAQ